MNELIIELIEKEKKESQLDQNKLLEYELKINNE